MFLISISMILIEVVCLDLLENQLAKVISNFPRVKFKAFLVFSLSAAFDTLKFPTLLPAMTQTRHSPLHPVTQGSSLAISPESS